MTTLLEILVFTLLVCFYCACSLNSLSLTLLFVCSSIFILSFMTKLKVFLCLFPIPFQYEGKIKSWRMTKSSIHLTHGGHFLGEYHISIIEIYFFNYSLLLLVSCRFF